MALRVRVQDGIKTIGAAFADATNRDLGVAEFAENDLFTNTEVCVPSLRRESLRTVCSLVGL